MNLRPNRSVNTDAHGRPLPSVAPFRGRRLRLRYAALLIAALCTSLAASPAHAQGSVKLSAALDACIDKADAVDAALHACYDAEYKVQDKRLNDAYRKLMSQLEPDRKKELIEVQRLWLRFADANCTFYFDKYGGTAARMSASYCTVVMRAARAQELENLTQ